MAVWINPDWAGIEAGTKAEPYAGIDSMIATVGWVQGTTYYLKAGTTDTLAAGVAIQLNDITFLPYTDGRDDFYLPFLRPVIVVTTDVNTIAVGGLPAGLVTGFTIRGVDVRGAALTVARCIYILSTSLTDTSDVANALIEDCIVRDGGLNNIRLYASGITIRSSEIYSADQDNIFTSGANDVTIEDNIIYGSGRGGVQADGVQVSGNAGPTANADRNIIRRNNITNDSGLKNCIIAPWTTSIGGIIEDNILNADDCLVALSVQGVGTVVRGNTITAKANNKHIVSMADGFGSGIIFTGNKIIDLSPSKDLVFNTMMSVLSDNNVISNNVFKSDNYQQYYSAVSMPLIGITGNVVANNIIDGVDIGMIQHSTEPNIETNNKYKNITLYNYSDSAATPAEMTTTNEVTDADDLDDNLRPGNNSELHGKGLHLSIKYRDFQNRRFKIPPAVGAYDFSGRLPVKKI